MPDFGQTVYDVGDPITSQLTLGVTPDGTTTVALVVTRPDGTVVTPPVITPFTGDVKTAQWWATDDGTSTGPTSFSAGDWLALWKVTGTGANILPKVYNVAPLPGVGTRPAWSPFLSNVADHVPYLTVDTNTPGQQVYLGTFTGTTTPTDEIAQRHIDLATSMIAPLLPGMINALYPAARGVVALRAAASLARAYARRQEDIAAAASLNAQADSAWKLLVEAYGNNNQGTTGVDVPYWNFPAPVAWGDTNL